MKWDLNLDAGEDPKALVDGSEQRLYSMVARVNVACGGHAGDEASMHLAVRYARAAGALLGAHPSYPDRENFGRRAMKLETDEVIQFVADQVGALRAVAESEGVPLVHVKPHGALYNACANDEALAAAIAVGTAFVDPTLVLVGLAESECLKVWRGLGFKTLGEGFADRGYRANGTLVARAEAGALIRDPQVAAAQAKALLGDGKIFAVTGEPLTLRCETVCVHGDNPAAESILSALRTA